MRGPIVVFLVLLAAYSASLAVDATARSAYTTDEAHELLMARSIVSDGDVDLRNQFQRRDYDEFHRPALVPRAQLTGGRLHEPYPLGFPLLVAPLFALGGGIAVQAAMGVLAALAFALAVPLARRLLPDPQHLAAVAVPLAAGLSPPALAAATSVTPEVPAAAALAGAVLIAVRLRERGAGSAAPAYWAALLLAALPWLGTRLTVAGFVAAVFLVRTTARMRRTTSALWVAEVMVGSLVVFVTFNGELYGGLTPAAALPPGETATGASTAAEYLERVPLLVGVLLDRDVGLLRWAPWVVLVGVAAWLLWRSRREHLAWLLGDERREVEAVAELLFLVAGVQVAVAALLIPGVHGEFFPGRHLLPALPLAAALGAWGMSRVPRAGAAICALTLVPTVWLTLELTVGPLDGWLDFARSDAPVGPAIGVLPRFGADGVADEVVAFLVVLATAVAAGIGVVRRRRLMPGAGG